LSSQEVTQTLTLHFGQVFERTVISVSPSELEEALTRCEFSTGTHVRDRVNIAVEAAKGSEA
jgi:hypothetical protein